MNEIDVACLIDKKRDVIAHNSTILTEEKRSQCTEQIPEKRE